MGSMPAFRLSKWYLDSVDDAGDVTILYTGTARWGAVHLNYSSVIESNGGRVTGRQSLRRAAEPRIEGESLRWCCRALAVDGSWTAAAGDLRAIVFESAAGSIEWQCLMPRALSRINEHGGLGYVEHLAMSIAPWKLPLRTLRWGRFGSEAGWIVWIDWRGESSRTLLYRDNRPAEARAVSDSAIEFADGSRLTLDRSLTIREGPLGSTVFRAIPGVRNSAPARLMRISEHKWRSGARLESPGQPPVTGWAIHEKVVWPE